MSHLHILTEVFSKPWLVEAVTHGNIARIVGQRAGLIPVEGRMPADGSCGEEVEQDEMEVIDGVAYIPIGGVLASRTTSFERGSGVVDYQDIREELRIAEEDDEVVAIVLDMDTPGGTVGGCIETADVLSDISKPVVAYTSGMICSAGYWLASQADKIVATRGADIGSIGVYCAFVDISEYYKKLGVSVELFTSGEHKGAGYPGTSLSKKQRQEMEASIMRIHEQFASAVQSARPQVSSDIMDGRVFDAMQALELGLVDDIVSSRADAAMLALSLANS